MGSTRFEELAKLPYENPSMYQFIIIEVMGKYLFDLVGPPYILFCCPKCIKSFHD